MAFKQVRNELHLLIISKGKITIGANVCHNAILSHFNCDLTVTKLTVIYKLNTVKIVVKLAT